MTDFTDKGRPDGEVYGRSDGKIAFFGYTPVVQQTATNQSTVATTAITTVATAAITAVATTAITAVSTATPVTGGYGFSTTTESAAVATAVNSLITRVAAIETAANSLITRVDANVTASNSLITRAAAINTYVLQTRADLIAYGLQKGSA